MKGFGIEVKNTLLEGKHFRAMSGAIWLYIWLLDHITSVTEDGVGVVLGGKPITYDEIEADLGISRDSYTRMIKRLEAYPYIQTRRTPYGISYNVVKAHKRFKNVIYQKNPKGKPCEWCDDHSLAIQKHHYPIPEKDGGKKTVDICVVCHAIYHSTGHPPEHPIYRDSAKARGVSANSRPPTAQTKNVLLTTTVDSTVDNTPTPSVGKLGNEVIDLFKDLNPSYRRLFMRKPQHESAERLVQQHGLEKLKGVVAFIGLKRPDRFCPNITTPMQLEEKWGALESYASKLKGAKREVIV